MTVIPEQLQAGTVEIINYGLAGYSESLSKQHELCTKRRLEQIPDTVLIVEHKPVITLGARRNANKVVLEKDELAGKGIDVFEIRRGGGTTAHNPGQLVFYPIVNLKELRLGISDYIRTLEQVGIELLACLGVAADRRKGYPGLWTGGKKIASVGVRISRSITHHGMAININNDLSIFDYIVPCGLEDVKMTSVLKETSKKHSMAEVKQKLTELIQEHLGKTVNTNLITGNKQQRLPSWLKRPLPAGEKFVHTQGVLNNLELETICVNANCPNRGQCWSRGTATVLILGNVCTRNCGFCSVATGKPEPPDPTEPARLAQMVRKMNLKYLVITSVDRDDLVDGGAGHFRDCVNTVRRMCPETKFEILVPDFRNCQNQAIEILKDALPFVFAHNVETVSSLYNTARRGGDYQLSLNLLKSAKTAYPEIPTKSSIMLGLGETDAEVEQVLKDLRKVGCERITIGQYLKPFKDCLDVTEYIPPDKFDFWKTWALEMGFCWVISSPFARSSYFAELETAK